MTVQYLRRPGANVQAVQLNAAHLFQIRRELRRRGIRYEAHGHGLLLTGSRGQPLPCHWGDWVVFDGDGYWDVYGDVVVRGWEAA
ncbi:hypothetical protein [Blastococcus sp. SYSU D00813]